MTCEFYDCKEPATDVVVLDAFRPPKSVCPEHASWALKTLDVRPLLDNIWWPPKGSRNTSRRWTHGQDWRPLA